MTVLELIRELVRYHPNWPVIFELVDQEDEEGGRGLEVEIAETNAIYSNCGEDAVRIQFWDNKGA